MAKRPLQVTQASDNGPRSTSLLLSTPFCRLLAEKRKELSDQANKLRNGLFKIDETREKVEIMTLELEEARRKVAEFQKQCEEYLVIIVQQKREADEQQKVSVRGWATARFPSEPVMGVIIALSLLRSPVDGVGQQREDRCRGDQVQSVGRQCPEGSGGSVARPGGSHEGKRKEDTSFKAGGPDLAHRGGGVEGLKSGPWSQPRNISPVVTLPGKMGHAGAMRGLWAARFWP